MPTTALQEPKTGSDEIAKFQDHAPSTDSSSHQNETATYSIAKPKQCGSHYKKLAFALPFFAVYLSYLGADCSPCACPVAITAGLLAGATSLGLYKAVKIVRHQKC